MNDIHRGNKIMTTRFNNEMQLLMTRLNNSYLTITGYCCWNNDMAFLQKSQPAVQSKFPRTVLLLSFILLYL